MKIQFFVFILLFVVNVRAAESEPELGRKEQVNALFSSTNVLRIQIEIPPDGIDKLANYQWQPNQQAKREKVKATIREGENIYTNVALHLKGAAGSFRSVHDNPAMTLNFDKHVKKQWFHGLDKLSLNNSVQDPTFLSEQFCRELFLKAGVPVPRATHAIVELNGRKLGMYVLVEGFDKQFLKRHFKNPDGNLYDGGFLKDIDSKLSVNSGENPDNQSDRIALLRAVQETDLQKRLTLLKENLDVDRFLTFMALDVMMWNWDGYAQNRNNWRLFHDQTSGKMVFMPHGLDQMFWKPDGSIFPSMSGMVAKAALQIPELRSRYFERLKELQPLVFQPAVMTNRVREIAAKIQFALEKHDPALARQHEEAVATFSEAITLRAASVAEQIATPFTPLQFGPSGMALLSGWAAKADFGRPESTRKTSTENEDVLHLVAKEGSSIGTWRSKVWLESGRYRLEGNVRTRDIVPDLGDPRGGATIRIGKNRPEHYILKATDWQEITREFTLDDAINEVQVICEFRGVSGEASFRSIRLQRLSTE